MALKDGYPVPQALIDWEKSDSCPRKTLADILDNVAEKYGDRPYVGKKVGKEFVFKTYAQVYEEVHCFASNLLELGLEKEDRVANYCNNRPEWPVIDFGSSYIGCVHVPMYPTLSQSEMGYIVRQSEARVLIVPDKDHLTKAINEADKCLHLSHIVCIESFDISQIAVPDGVRVWAWDAFLQAGRDALKKNRHQIKLLRGQLKATDVASFVYTSGTTGDPKGAMLMHGNFVCLAEPCTDLIIQSQPTDVQLSFLPLSHVFERIVHYAVMCRGASIGFCKSIASVPSDMVTLKPHIVTSVPRLFEKVFAKAAEQAASGLRKKIFDDAIATGRAYREAQSKGKVPFMLRAEHALYDKLVYSKIREKVGGRVRYFISGGAPLRRDVAEFFLNVGLCVLEGYGLTETAPLLSVNHPDCIKIGSVGLAAPGVEVKTLDDGEIVARGPNVMLGYFGMPEATREVIDEDGWFHTGDVGEIDEGGFITITDRKKEILVLSNGKNVAPQPIELKLCANLFIAQAVLVGNNRGYVAGIIVPNFERLEAWAKEKGIPCEDHAELVKKPEVVSLYKGIVAEVCAPLSNYENVRKIHILGRELSAAADEITPTLKVKRRIIDLHFKEEIEALYHGD